MAWTIRREKNKYRIYSTIVDDYITELLTRRQAIEFIEEVWKEDLEEKIEELRATFPNGWYDSKNGRQIEDKRYPLHSKYVEKKYRLSKLKDNK